MKDLEDTKSYDENSNDIKSSVMPYSHIHSAKTYTHLDKKQDEIILHQDTTKIKTRVPKKNRSPMENEWSKFNHKDWYCQGLAKKVFSTETKHDLEKRFGSDVTDMIYQCVGSQIALKNNDKEYHKEINSQLSESLSNYNSNSNIKISNQNNVFLFQIVNKSFKVSFTDRVCIETDDISFYSNCIEAKKEEQQEKQTIEKKKRDTINDGAFYKDISSIKHEDWLYIGIAKDLFSNYDIDRLKTVLNANQLNYVYEYVGTQRLLNQSKQILNSSKLNQHTYDIVEKNIVHLENHLYGLSQRVSDYDELELKISDDYRIKSLATSSHFVDFSKEDALSIKKKFGLHIDKLEYKPLIDNSVENLIHAVSASNTDNDDSISNTTLDMTLALKDVPSTVKNVHDKIKDSSNGLEERIKEDYSVFKQSSSLKEGVKNVIKDNVKTGVDKGISSIKDLPKKIATSVGKKALNTKPDLATNTDTGIDGIKTGVSGVRTAIDTKRTIDNTVTASKKFIKNVKNTPKAVAKDIQKIKKIFLSIKQSSVGVIIVGVAFFLLIIPVIFGGAVSRISSNVSSLFGWLYDEDDKSKVALEVLYDDWEYISKLLEEVQSTYDTILDNPESINSNWKESFERSDSEKHLYGYQDTILGEKFNYKEISLNVLSALAIDRYNQLVASSGSTTGTVTQAVSLVTNSKGQISLEFTEEEIQKKLKLFYETEYIETTFYCANSVLNIDNAYNDCKFENLFSNTYNTFEEKKFIYGDRYNQINNTMSVLVDGQSNYSNLIVNQTYYKWHFDDNFVMYDLAGNGVTCSPCDVYIIGYSFFSSGEYYYFIRFNSLENPSYDTIYVLYSSQLGYYIGDNEFSVLDVNCKGHERISCYIVTKIKDKITAKDLGFTNEEYELFLLVKEELEKIIDEDNPSNTTTVVATS